MARRQHKNRGLKNVLKDKRRNGVDKQLKNAFSGPLSRKLRRKQERILKKAKRRGISSFPSFTQTPNQEDRPEKNEECEVNVSKKKKKSQKVAKLQEKDFIKERNEARKRQLLEENEIEDRNINKLLKQMKLHRRKSKSLPMCFVKDGLDYVLNACDGICIDEDEPDLDSVELSEKKATETGPPKKKVRFSDDVPRDASEESSIEESSAEDIASEDTASEDTASEDSDEEETDSEENKNSENEEILVNKYSVRRDKSNVREDIYGRLRNEKGDIVPHQNVAAYTPPAKRAQVPGVDDAKKALLLRLRRQLQGHLNRLSESNVQPIATEIEKLYSRNSRNDINETMMTLILDSLVQLTPIPERLIQEHALLVALLHGNVGTEIGAHFLQSITNKFDDMHQNASQYTEGSRLNNLLLFLSHLYNFKVTDSVLIYDVLNRLADGFTEKDVELVLLILRSVGFTLRKDDPIALKQMIIKLQSKAPTEGIDTQSRVHFLLETVMAIRNNNMSKIPNYDPTHTQHLKKLLRCFLRQGCSVVELKISLADLLSAPTHGRWWVVGSAWNNPNEKEDLGEDGEEDKVLNVETEGEDVLELAKAQRMNTDVRKKVFCVIMKAEDYMDAFEKLMQLGLKHHQEREIIIVSTECCMREKKFNPFYAHLIQKFCTYDKRFRLTMQYTIWDKLKELQKLTASNISHLALMLAHLCLTKAMSISVLKVIQFSEMNGHLVKFLREVLLNILLHDPEDTCTSVFVGVVLTKRRVFIDGLRLFMRHFLLRNKSKLLDQGLHAKLETRVNLVTDVLDADRKVMF